MPFGVGFPDFFVFGAVAVAGCIGDPFHHGRLFSEAGVLLLDHGADLRGLLDAGFADADVHAPGLTCAGAASGEGFNIAGAVQVGARGLGLRGLHLGRGAGGGVGHFGQ